MNYQNNINTYADLTAYNADQNKDFPNISYIQGSDEVKWNKYDPDHIVCVYNVTSTESATKLLGTNSGITYQIIDGVQQQSVKTTYTFDTLGEHIVKYKLSGTIIASSQFNQCQAIVSVSIPVGVTSIVGSSAVGAFRYCTSLKEIVIPDTMVSIGQNTFQECSKITNGNGRITLKSVKTIGNSAFYNDNGLRLVDMPNVTSIGNGAFYSYQKHICLHSETPPTLGNNNSLGDPTNSEVYVFVPEQYINNYTTYKDYGYNIFSLPMRQGKELVIKTQGSYYFYNLFNQNAIVNESIVENGVIYLDDNKIDTTQSQWINQLVPNGNHTIRIQFIWDERIIYPFASTANYTKSFVKEIILPSNVEVINSNTFLHCAITTLTIPSTIKKIANYSFSNCNSLTSITVEATTPPTLGGTNAFYNTNDCPIYVPAESVDAYKAATNWSTYASRIQAIPTT